MVNFQSYRGTARQEIIGKSFWFADAINEIGSTLKFLIEIPFILPYYKGLSTLSRQAYWTAKTSDKRLFWLKARAFISEVIQPKLFNSIPSFSGKSLVLSYSDCWYPILSSSPPHVLPKKKTNLKNASIRSEYFLVEFISQETYQTSLCEFSNEIQLVYLYSNGLYPVQSKGPHEMHKAMTS